MDVKSYRLKRHSRKWEEQSKSVKRFVIAGLLFSVLLPIKVLNPFVDISKDASQVEQNIIDLQMEQREAEEQKQILSQAQEILKKVQKTIMDEPWMAEKDRLIQTLSDIRAQSPRGGNWEEYQATADDTIRTISAQVREQIIQPLEGFVEKAGHPFPELADAVDRLGREMERWESGHLGRRWYNTFFAKDREMQELTYSLEQMLGDITRITQSALSKAKEKQEAVSDDMARLEKEIEERESQRDGLNGRMQKLLPEWLRDILSIEQMLQLFPVILIGLVAWITAMAVILSRHFEKAASLMGLELKDRIDPVSSSIWTLTYRKVHGTVLTILSYLAVILITACCFEWGLVLLDEWLLHGGGGEWISGSFTVSGIRWIGRLLFVAAALLVFFIPVNRWRSLRRTKGAATS